MRIYEQKSTPEELAANGIGNLTAEYAVVHEEINGEYSLTFKVAQASEHFADVIIGAIIKAETPKGKQYFRCSKPITMLDGGKEVFAWHISYDLAQDIILNRTWTGKTGAEALSDILQAGISETRFTGTSDIDLVTNMRIVRTSVLGAIIGEQDNSFVNRWGGEIERDNFTVNVLARLGADKGVTVRYRKNLTGLTIDEDDKEIANRIIPTGLDEDDSVIMLPEVYIDSDLIDDTPVPHVRHVHFSDIKVGKKDEDDEIPYPDAASVITELRARVAEMYAQGIDLPLKSANVEFIDLSQTEEYKNYKQLETVSIGDTIECVYQDITLTQRVISYDYDALAKKYISIVLGNMVPLLGDSLWAQDLDLSALKDDMSNTIKQSETYNGCYINHEDGFMTVANVGGKEIKIKHTSTEGLSIYADDAYIGGVAVINGEVVFAGNMLTNDLDGDCFAAIGEVEIGGILNRGLFIYNKTVSESEPTLKITTHKSTLSDETYGGFIRLLTFNGAEMWLGRSNTSMFRFIDHNGKVRINVNYLWSEIQSPNGNNSVGVNDTGIYKKIGGSQTWL